MVNNYPANIFCPDVFLLCLLHLYSNALAMNPDQTETKGRVRSGSICCQNTSSDDQEQ